jgi:hypothetical protein
MKKAARIDRQGNPDDANTLNDADDLDHNDTPDDTD